MTNWFNIIALVVVIGLFGLWIGARGLYMYYRYDFYPPDDERYYVTVNLVLTGWGVLSPPLAYALVQHLLG